MEARAPCKEHLHAFTKKLEIVAVRFFDPILFTEVMKLPVNPRQKREGPNIGGDVVDGRDHLSHHVEIGLAETRKIDTAIFSVKRRKEERLLRNFYIHGSISNENFLHWIQ
jgi:hypothetical protein